MIVDLSSATSLIVIKPSSLGDVVHTIPSVSLIARAFPQLGIRWLVNPEWAPLIENLPWLSATVPFPRSQFRGVGGILRFFCWRHELRNNVGTRPDVAIDFQGLLRSGLVSKWSGAPVRMGTSDSREGARFFHNQIVPVDPQAHAVDRYLSVVRALGIDVPDSLPWELPAGEMLVDDRLDGSALELEQCIVLHPYSRGEGKALSDQQVIQFCNACRGSGREVIIVGRGTNIAGLPQNARDLTNRTSLPQLIGLLRRAGWVVSVDSGPMHIAAAATPRLLGIHTWSDPCKVGPYRPEAWIYKGGQFFHRENCPIELRKQKCPLTQNDATSIAQFVLKQMACQ
ncbi:MAG: heptosyltransferase-1 [Verrucomicrobiales bacterium]